MALLELCVAKQSSPYTCSLILGFLFNNTPCYSLGILSGIFFFFSEVDKHNFFPDDEKEPLRASGSRLSQLQKYELAPQL